MTGILSLAVVCCFTLLFSFDREINEYAAIILNLYITGIVIFAVLGLLIIYIGSAIPREVISLSLSFLFPVRLLFMVLVIRFFLVEENDNTNP